MTHLTTVVSVIDEEASLDHVARYRSHRPGLHFEHYDYAEFDRTSSSLTIYGFVLAVMLVLGASLLAGVLQ